MSAGLDGAPPAGCPGADGVLASGEEVIVRGAAAAARTVADTVVPRLGNFRTDGATSGCGNHRANNTSTSCLPLPAAAARRRS
jgi:hypothetical protein